MPNQSAANVLAAIKREATLGVAPGATGAEQLRLIDSPGLKMDRGQIRSGERRRDLLTRMGRLGAKSINGTYNTELTVGGAIDMLLESIVRSVWSDPLVTVLGATDGTTTANTIVRATGSWLTDGYRVGDVVTITGDATTANNDLRVRVTAVNATTLTLAATPLTANATARAFTVTRLKKVITPAVPIFHSYAVEQHDLDIDESELFLGVRLGGLTLSLRPNAMTTCAWGFLGLDRDVLGVAETPYFTDPNITEGDPLVADDSWIRYRGEDVAAITGLDLTFAINQNVLPVIGSTVSPDVFVNDLTVSGSVTGVRQDLSNLSAWDNETEFEISALLVEPGTDPKPAMGVFVPRVKIGDVSASFVGGDGAKIETRSLMMGPRTLDTGYDASLVNFFSSAP